MQAQWYDGSSDWSSAASFNHPPGQYKLVDKLQERTNPPNPKNT